jgi:hypothetical protein
MGRRRKSSSAGSQSSEGKSPSEAKSLSAAREAAESAPDPEAEARKKAASQKRFQDTNRSVRAATEDLDMWVADQLRTGLMGFLSDLGSRCRRIAARLVDAKAGALASRVDEMPSRLLSLSAEERVDAAIGELGKLVLLTRAWRTAPNDPELRREVVTSETREDVLANPAALRIASVWEILGERISTRRDGLVSQATWLMNLQPGPQRFALLLDFFPASAGRRASAFAAGDRFTAELVFYPGSAPLRAVVASRGDPDHGHGAWPKAPPDPFTDHAEQMAAVPWRTEVPVLLPEGRLCADSAGRTWWRSAHDQWALLRDAPPPLALGAAIERAAGIWDGMRLSLIAAQTNWGRLNFDA